MSASRSGIISVSADATEADARSAAHAINLVAHA
jgi:hypothetical protein